MKIAPKAAPSFVMLWSTWAARAIGQDHVATRAAMLGAKTRDFGLTEWTPPERLKELASGLAPFALGFENILQKKFRDPLLPAVRFSLQLHDKTVSEILDALCHADARHTGWECHYIMQCLVTKATSNSSTEICMRFLCHLD